MNHPVRMVLMVFFLAAACSSGENIPGDPAGGGAAPAPPPLPEAVCNRGSAWQAGSPAFRDATAAWLPGSLDVTGVRINAVDVDGDGWTDLIVRRVGVEPDNFAPGGKRSTWLLRNREGNGFEDITQASGFAARRIPMENLGRPYETTAFGDVDNDGDLDAYTGLNNAVRDYARGETSEIMINQGGGRFVLGPAESNLRRVTPDAPAGASFVDADLDGKLDLWVAMTTWMSSRNGPLQQQDRLYLGDGAGSFADVTDGVGLTTQPWVNPEDINQGRAHSWAWSGTACDLNDDGLPELLAASYGRSPNHLWQASAEGGGLRYINRSAASGFIHDGDQQWQDNQFARCYCSKNRSADGCAGAPEPAVDCSRPNWNHDIDRQPFRLGGNSGATVCADINNDGRLDLLTTEIRHWWAGEGSDHSEILLNTGEKDVRFIRPGREALGMTIPHPAFNWDEGHMTASVFDFDNDAWPDVFIGASDYPGNRALLFRQNAPLKFSETALAAGLEHNRSHGVAAADFDRDGDLDVVLGHSHARCDPQGENNCYPTPRVRFFENISAPGNWIQLGLKGGPSANRSAIGARVRVTAGGVTQTQEVNGGYGHFGAQNDLTLHFGLGAACQAEIEVRWPRAGHPVEKFSLPAGHRFLIEEGRPPRRWAP
ncbi:MAG: hypothetical protein GMKNLPBB_02957 [Myxococcota bacterium]|nr:hypothetical protein [Myxococcota bacterium]